MSMMRKYAGGSLLEQPTPPLLTTPNLGTLRCRPAMHEPSYLTHDLHETLVTLTLWPWDMIAHN